MTTIAFIGLGNMGAPMAINLQKAGHAVRAFDLSAEAVRTTWGEALTSGQKLASYCLTEPGAGSDAASLKTLSLIHI